MLYTTEHQPHAVHDPSSNSHKRMRRGINFRSGKSRFRTSRFGMSKTFGGMKSKTSTTRNAGSQSSVVSIHCYYHDCTEL